MQRTNFLKFMIFGAILLLLASCTKTNTQGRLIPKEASFVIQLDGKSLSSKLPWSEIKQNPFFQDAYNDSSIPAAIKSVLDNPENAGIDPTTDFTLFTIKDSLGAYIAFTGSIKDEKLFKAFNLQVSENGTESEKDGVQFISKSPVCIGWTKEKFVYLLDAPQMAGMDELSRRMIRDSINITRASARDIGATCKAIFDLKEINTLAKNEKFTALMKEKGDIRFWTNVEELNKSTFTPTPLAMMNLEKLFKGNITTGIVNFENGKMLVKAKSYASDELVDIFRKYGGGKINEEMIKRIPGKDVVAVMALNFKPEGIKELIKLTGLDGLVNIGVSSFGFTMDDFIKANKGDIVAGFYDLTLKTDSVTYNFKDQEPNMALKQIPSFNFIFSAAIGDKDAFNKLVNAGKKIGKTAIPDSTKSPFAFNSNGTYFALSNTKENVDHYLGTATTNFDFLPKITGEPFGVYLNIQSLLKTFAPIASKDSTAKIAYDATAKMWENVLWKGGNYNDGAIQQSIEINLMDKTTNSLKQLNQYAAQMALLFKESKKRKKEEMMAFDNNIYAPMVTDTTATTLIDK